METTPPNEGATRNTRTPGRRAISAEPPSSRKSVHTPLDRNATRELVNSIRRGTSASGGRRNNAPTPHAKAARRALDQRRTAIFTPGKNRRRSQIVNRESPMSFLRQLGEKLATTSKPILSSSSPRDDPSSSILPIHDDDDDELPIDRPRLSLPLDEDDDDDSDLQPPRSSILEDPNYTVQSIELPRRAISEQPGSRLSGGSFGSMRMSDIFEDNGGDFNSIGDQSDFFPGLRENLEAIAVADETFERYAVEPHSIISSLLTLHSIDADPSRRFTLGRESGFNLQMPAELDEPTTFLMSEPGADLPQTSPIADISVAEAVAFDAQEPFDALAPAYSGDDTEDEIHDDTDVGEADMDTEIPEPQPRDSAKTAKSSKKQKRVSRHGIEYPPLPPAFVKRVAQTALQTSGLSNHRISPETLTALTQASEWFFEQLGDDLGAYASHAKRKTIEESDVVTLMRR